MLQLVLFWFWFCLSVPLARALEFRYHNSTQLEQYLHEINKNFSSITHLHSIGQSVEGRQLWVLVLGQHPQEHRVGIPEFKYVGNMHGNEVHINKDQELQLSSFDRTCFCSSKDNDGKI
ncbi:carboxypeptidase M-like [Trichomycterus rosablanca]|uniref:carboxypeptidase M-like n=1 Tax=Trichomycterus rosablanca TaxID=2290929 RepID=UPI002F35D14F